MYDYYKFAYKDLYEKHWVKTIIFFDKKLSEKSIIDNNNNYYQIFFYDSKIDLLEKITKFNKNDIYFINTFDEILVTLLHEIRKHLWIKVSKEYISFRNKHIQRNILIKKFSEATVDFVEIDFKKQNIDDYYKILDFPYIIKPSSWVQSSWVWIIKNKNDLEKYIENVKILNENMISRWIDNNLFLIEEYIDGEMYTIVYFVDNDWNISYSPIVKVNSAQNIWIDDFSNYVRLSWTIIDNEVSFDEIKSFVEKHVDIFGMRNTYMFQEFKKNSKWELKNIELNARIWWYRLEMVQKIYDYNLLEMPFWNVPKLKSDFSNAVFVFYSSKKGILKWFNEKLINDYKQLDSYYNIRISNNYLWKEVWTTKDWFSSIVALRIKNKNLIQFKKDYKFIEDNYNKLIILE